MNIFITGATTGIGFELAKSYLETGNRVALTGRDLSKLPEDFSEKYHLAKLYEVDVCDEQKMSEVIEEFSREGLDVIIANAGISDGQKLDLPDFQRARKIMNTNVLGLINTFEPAMKYFIKHKKGHLVALSSVAAFMGVPGSGPYCGSKAAVQKMCESLTIDLKKYGISVTTICPGFIDTPLTRQNDHGMPFLMSADKAVVKIIKAIHKKKPLFIFPWPMALTVTFLNKIPRFLYRAIMTKINYAKESS
jgi:short-subunit dehydrogenase